MVLLYEGKQQRHKSGVDGFISYELLDVLNWCVQLTLSCDYENQLKNASIDKQKQDVKFY